MAKIILSLDGEVLQEITLSKERVTIGRHPQNDVVLDNRAVSGQHAVIVTILHDSFLEDLNSTNGTQVNGHPIKKHFLQNNDVVALAKYRIKFVGDAARGAAQPSTAPVPKVPAPMLVARPSAALDDGPRTIIVQASPPGPVAHPSAGNAAIGPAHGAQLHPATDKATPSHPAPTRIAASPPLPATASPRPAGAHPAAGAQPSEGASIRVLNGPNARKELALTKPLTTIGRPGSQVAVITHNQQGWFITHIEGNEPPRLNGEPLGKEARRLSDKDVIDLGGTQMRFLLGPRPAKPA